MAQAKKALNKQAKKNGRAPSAARETVKTYYNYIGGEWVRSAAAEWFENLNPADTRDCVGRSDDRKQPLRNNAQDLVADGVAEAVVDDFEPVEVEEQQRRTIVVAVPGDDAAGTIFRRAPAGSAGAQGWADSPTTGPGPRPARRR